MFAALNASDLCFVAGEGFKELQLTDDIPRTISDQVHCSHCCFLCVSGDITTDETQDSHEWGRARLRQVISGQSTVFVRQGKRNDKDDAQEGYRETDHGD